MVEEEGYILKQIKAVAKAIAKILFNRDSYDYVLPKDGKYNQYDNLYLTIMGLADDNKFNEAEDLLFENVDGRNAVYMQIAFAFYEKLAGLSDEVLKANNFSKEEVEQGFIDVLKKYNIRVDKQKSE